MVEEDSRITWLRSRWRGGKPHSTGRELFDLINLHSDSLWVTIQIREAEPLYDPMCSEPPLSRNFVIQVRKRLLYSRVSCCDVRARATRFRDAWKQRRQVSLQRDRVSFQEHQVYALASKAPPSYRYTAAEYVWTRSTLVQEGPCLAMNIPSAASAASPIVLLAILVSEERLLTRRRSSGSPLLDIPLNKVKFDTKDQQAPTSRGGVADCDVDFTHMCVVQYSVEMKEVVV